jgi:hypothetical protein
VSSVQEFTVRSRPSAHVSVQEKFDDLVRALCEEELLSAADERLRLKIDFGNRELESISLNRLLRRGLRGSVSFIYRSPELTDDAVEDDVLTLEFRARDLIDSFLEGGTLVRLLKAFDAYRAELAPRELLDEIADAEIYEDRRREVKHVFPVSFYDDLLCTRAFSKSPVRIHELLTESCVRSELVQQGILIVGSGRPLECAEAREYSLMVLNALGKL